MFRYVLPALIPSWRFFDYIAPSPRIEFAVVAAVDDPAMLARVSPAAGPFAGRRDAAALAVESDLE